MSSNILSRYLFRIVKVVAFIFFPLLVKAQGDVWSLKKCIEYAHEKNITIQKFKLNVESNKATLTQSWASLFPTLNGSMAESFNFGLRFDPTTGLLNDQRFNTTAISASSQFIIFNGLANYHSIGQSQSNLKAAQYDFQQARDDISINIANVYMQVLFAEERLEIVKQQVDVLDQQVKRSRQLFEAGIITKGALMSIEAQLSTQQLTKVNGENALASVKLSLIQLLQLDGFEIQIEKPDFSAVEPEILNESESVQMIYNSALLNRPNILSREWRMKSAKQGLAIARGSYYPQILLNTSVSTIYSGLLKQNPFDPNSPVVPFFDQLERNNAQQFSFGMNIPLFNGLQIRTAVKQSKIAYKNAELDLMNEKFLLKNTIQKSYADAKAAFKTYQANQQGLASFKENFEYAKQRFEANLINSVDYNDAATRYFNARTESLIALYDYIFKSKVLDFYKGKKLEF